MLYVFSSSAWRWLFNLDPLLLQWSSVQLFWTCFCRDSKNIYADETLLCISALSFCSTVNSGLRDKRQDFSMFKTEILSLSTSFSGATWSNNIQENVQEEVNFSLFRRSPLCTPKHPRRPPSCEFCAVLWWHAFIPTTNTLAQRSSKSIRTNLYKF